MKLTKAFYKMSLQDQESYLITELEKIYESEKQIKRMLATVRGGYKYEVTTEPDRPDLMTMKLGE